MTKIAFNVLKILIVIAVVGYLMTKNREPNNINTHAHCNCVTAHIPKIKKQKKNKNKLPDTVVNIRFFFLFFCCLFLL